jgi:hypothetical protein
MRNLKFGIELEVATKKSREEVVNALVEHGIDAIGSSYGSSVNNTQWKVQYDGSIVGWEIVSPPLTNTEDLEKVAYVLRKVLKVQGSPKCGVHIHHDINDFNIEQIKNIYRLYNKYEKNAIQSIMRKQRINNAYARPITTSILNKVENAETIQDFKESKLGGRYLTLNQQAYIKYGTMEFRHHHGTSDVNEILTWVEITQKIVEAAQNGVRGDQPLQATTYEESLQEMFAEINLDNAKIQKLANNRRKAIEKADGRNSRIA